MISKKSRTYAQALLESEEKHDFLPLLKQLLDVFKEPEAMNFFLSRTVPLKSKKELMSSVLKSAPDLLGNFFFILLDCRAFSLFPQIVSAYQELKDEQNKICRGRLYSASPFPEEKKKQLEKSLTKFLNKKIELQQKEDKTLMGGFSVDVGGYNFSSTVQQDLRRFQNL